MPPIIPSLERQPSIGNVFDRTPSFGNAVGPLLPRQISSNENSSRSRASLNNIGAIELSQVPVSGINRQNSSGNTGNANGVLRQSSQGSLFEQIASQAKDLVRETTRQSSQDGILAHMDKVCWIF